MALYLLRGWYLKNGKRYRRQRIRIFLNDYMAFRYAWNNTFECYKIVKFKKVPVYTFKFQCDFECCYCAYYEQFGYHEED